MRAVRLSFKSLHSGMRRSCPIIFRCSCCAFDPLPGSAQLQQSGHDEQALAAPECLVKFLPVAIPGLIEENPRPTPPRSLRVDEDWGGGLTDCPQLGSQDPASP